MHTPESAWMAAYFREVKEHTLEEQRRHRLEHTTLIAEETYQLAMFDEPDELVQKTIVGVEIAQKGQCHALSTP